MVMTRARQPGSGLAPCSAGATVRKELVQFLQETHPNIRIAIITDEPSLPLAQPGIASGEPEDGGWSSIVLELAGDRMLTPRRFGADHGH